MLTTVRIRFSKTGTARYISHLDLSRTMMRALRRARAPVWYTEGYNKHPFLTFTAPLSLGYEGLDECMDVKSEEPGAITPDGLNVYMPAGLRILSVAPAVRKPGALAAASYRLTVDIPPEELRTFFARPEITAEKRMKNGKIKTIQIKEYITDLKIEKAPAGAVAVVTLPAGGETNINPGLLLDAMGCVTGRSLRTAVVRTALLDADGEIFR